MSWGHKGRHSDQTTAKLRIRSEIYLQPHKSPLMSHKCSPQRHLFFSPEYFQNDSPASLESTVLSHFGESLCQWHSSSLIHIQKLVKRAETLNWRTGSWKIWLPGLKSCSVWTSKEVTRGRSAGQALYLPPEQQQLPCTSPIYLTHHQPWFLHDFFPNLSSHQCVTHWATLNEQFHSL